MTESLRPRTKPLQFGEFLHFLFPEFDATTPPKWPPDVFGVALASLWRAAAYPSLLDRWSPDSEMNQGWAAAVKYTGLQWRQTWSGGTTPSTIIDRWVTSFKDVDFPVMDLSSHHEQCRALLELVAIADEACVGLGIPVQDELSAEEEEFCVYGDELLADQAYAGASLCEALNGSRVRVLPKMHCPQSGLTIRSFSHHLALYLGSEITPMWHSRSLNVGLALNIMVVPWPYRMSPRQFRQCAALPGELSTMDSTSFGFFAIDSDNTDDDVAVADILSVVEAGEELIGKLHGVILPEMALSHAQHERLKEMLLDRDIFLVSGVGQSDNDTAHAKNEVHVTFPHSRTVSQSKHHRWRIEENQIIQYGLGGRLAPEVQWWEHIKLGERTLGFFSLLPWLVASVLICEDLARPDPVGDLVRAIAPNLVIALLMDGPQLKERWSARYATTLADDPGCSVLSVTSLGMSQLSRPRGSSGVATQIVAIWKDAKSGGPIQIELPSGHHGVVLSLSRHNSEEWTADGRSSISGYPILTGVHAVKTAL